MNSVVNHIFRRLDVVDQEMDVVDKNFRNQWKVNHATTVCLGCLLTLNVLLYKELKRQSETVQRLNNEIEELKQQSEGV